MIHRGFHLSPTELDMNGIGYVASAALLLVWNPIARANAPAPPPKPETRVVAPLTIKRGEIRGEGRAVQAKITIPKKLVHAGPPAAGAAPPVPAPAAAPRAREQAGIPYGTIIAGLAMSAAAVSLVFVVRGSRTTKTTALAVLAGALILGAFSAAQADLIPGRPNGPVPPPAEIVIELVEDGEAVTLQLAR
jgi:hypothetical protein